MQFITSLASVGLLAAAGVSAAPTKTTGDVPTFVLPTKVTHTVAVGRNGNGNLAFDPDNVSALVGDVVEWHFLPRNHSVVQSSFDKPCEPLADEKGFYSGFGFATVEGQADNVFSIQVQDTNPIWYYCSQTTGRHCQKGMVGVINQNFNNPAVSLARHRELAADTKVSVSPLTWRGGEIKPNPNPLAGL